MANYTPQSPNVVGAVTPANNPAAASDTYDVQPNSRYLLQLKNAGGTVNNVVIDDPNSGAGAPGATVAQNPDVTIVVPITTGERFYLIDTNRFRDSGTGRITFTNSFTTTNTHNLYGPL